MGEPAASFLFPDRVRIEVLAQHRCLRELLQQAIRATNDGLRGLCDRSRMALHIRELDETFRAHLAYEERALVPIIATDEGWGPERAQAMLEEHRQQRSEMVALTEGIDEDWDTERLALALRSLAVDLIRDMREEENGRLSDAVLREPILERSARRRH
jgi:hypothetical protein